MTSPVRAATVDSVTDAVSARSAPASGVTGRHAVAALQCAVSGAGAAVYAETTSTGGAAIVARGPGTLLDLQDRAGRSLLSMGQSGLTGDLTVTSGDLVAATAGKGLKIKEGSNARMGTLTLTGVTPVVVATTAVTATSRIFLTTQDPNGGTPAFCYVSTRTAATSFSVVDRGVADRGARLTT
jgi:hypothetical protein